MISWEGQRLDQPISLYIHAPSLRREYPPHSPSWSTNLHITQFLCFPPAYNSSFAIIRSRPMSQTYDDSTETQNTLASLAEERIQAIGRSLKEYLDISTQQSTQEECEDKWEKFRQQIDPALQDLQQWSLYDSVAAEQEEGLVHLSKASAMYHDYAQGTYVKSRVDQNRLTARPEWKQLDEELTNYANIKEDFTLENPKSRKRGLMHVILGNEAYHRPWFQLKTYEELLNLFAAKEFHRGDLQSEH